MPGNPKQENNAGQGRKETAGGSRKTMFFQRSTEKEASKESGILSEKERKDALKQEGGRKPAILRKKQRKNGSYSKRKDLRYNTLTEVGRRGLFEK